jgi:NDP-sugar pyrophosphorylase family protein
VTTVREALARALARGLAGKAEVIRKPMVRIPTRPILWHVMKRCARHGFKGLSLAPDSWGETIKRYLLLQACSRQYIRIAGLVLGITRVVPLEKSSVYPRIA